MRSASPKLDSTAALHSRPKAPPHAGRVTASAASSVVIAAPSRFVDAQTVEGTTDNRLGGGRPGRARTRHECREGTRRGVNC
nr:hypothetical protein StreXyl84_48820 [Streptomyces sp. Xyl84]